MSAYLMVSLQTEELKTSSNQTSTSAKAAKEKMKIHPGWQERKGWKSNLTNLRIFLQLLYYFNLLKPGLSVLFTPGILQLFCRLFLTHPVDNFSARSNLSERFLSPSTLE
jgi:hypothetical protein